jgi:hypothetical protein
MSVFNRARQIVWGIIWVFFYSGPGFASNGTTKKVETPQTIAEAGTREVDKPLQITGQTRTLNMLLSIRSKADPIGFVSARKDFRDRIPNTQF